MPLESDDGRLGLDVINSGHIDAIAVARKHRLECFHLQSFGASLEPRTVFDGTRSDEVANSTVSQLTPKENVRRDRSFDQAPEYGMRKRALAGFSSAWICLGKAAMDRFDLLWLVRWQARNMAVVGDFRSQWKQCSCHGRRPKHRCQRAKHAATPGQAEKARLVRRRDNAPKLRSSAQR